MNDKVLITSEHVGKHFNLTLSHVNGLYIIAGEALNMSRLDHIEPNGRTLGSCYIDDEYWYSTTEHDDEHAWEELHNYVLCHIKLIEVQGGERVEHLLDIGIAVPTTGTDITYIGHHEYVRGDFTLIFVDDDLNHNLFDQANIVDRLENDNESN